MGSSDQESQEKLAETTSLMREKAKLSEKAEVSKHTGRVVVAGRKPSVSTGDKRERR